MQSNTGGTHKDQADGYFNGGEETKIINPETWKLKHKDKPRTGDNRKQTDKVETQSGTTGKEEYRRCLCNWNGSKCKCQICVPACSCSVTTASVSAYQNAERTACHHGDWHVSLPSSDASNGRHSWVSLTWLLAKMRMETTPGANGGSIKRRVRHTERRMGRLTEDDKTTDGEGGMPEKRKEKDYHWMSIPVLWWISDRCLEIDRCWSLSSRAHSESDKCSRDTVSSVWQLLHLSSHLWFMTHVRSF